MAERLEDRPAGDAGPGGPGERCYARGTLGALRCGTRRGRMIERLEAAAGRDVSRETFAQDGTVRELLGRALGSRT